MLFCRAALPLSSKALNFTAGIIRRPGRRSGRYGGSGALGVGRSRRTVWRYVQETVGLLAARAPRLRQAAREARKAGHANVIVDVTLIPVNRVARDRPFCSGKHKRHGVNLQVIASPGGDLLWVSSSLPGHVHDKRAEWIWGALDDFEKAANHAQG